MGPRFNGVEDDHDFERGAVMNDGFNGATL